MSYCHTVKKTRTQQQRPRQRQSQRDRSRSQTDLDPMDSSEGHRRHKIHQQTHYHDPSHHHGLSGTPHQPSHDSRYYSNPSPHDSSHHEDMEETPSQQDHPIIDSSCRFNPEKHAKMKEIAHNEEVMHNELITRKRQEAAEIVRQQQPQRLGGVKLPPHELQDTVRKQQEQDLKRAKIRRKIAEDERKERVKRQEQDKFDEHKREQRAKAEKLQKTQQAKNQVDLGELRRKRLERFS